MPAKPCRARRCRAKPAGIIARGVTTCVVAAEPTPSESAAKTAGAKAPATHAAGTKPATRWLAAGAETTAATAEL